MRITLQPAFVLHRRPYRETSRIVDLLTPEFGRISAVAKGVRRAKDSQGTLELFTPLLVSWFGRGELVNLSHSELQGATTPLRGDCLFAGLYLNELLIRLLPKSDPHPVLYQLYQETLSVLQFAPLTEHTLRLFEKRLLQELGYNLAPDEKLQKNLVIDKSYEFHPEQGFIEESVSGGAKERVFSGRSLIAFATETWTDEGTLRDAKRLVRLMLAHLLGNRPLYSRLLFQKGGKNE